MGDNCIFCKIIAGEAAGSFVYENEHVVAFLDINQPNEYKTLVLPRRHAEMIYDLSEQEATEILPVARKIAQAIQTITQCDGMNIFQANGAVAGQEVFHYHLHLLPRYKDDGHQWRKTNLANRETLDKLATDLRAELERQTGQ